MKVGTLPDEQGRFGITGRADYDPAPCPRCGSSDVKVNWENVTSATDPLGLEFFIARDHRCEKCGAAYGASADSDR